MRGRWEAWRDHGRGERDDHHRRGEEVSTQVR